MISDRNTLDILKTIYNSLKRVFEPRPIEWETFIRDDSIGQYKLFGKHPTELLATISLIRELDRRFPDQWDAENGEQITRKGTPIGGNVLAYINISRREGE